MKVCTTCKKPKKLSEFSTNKTSVNLVKENILKSIIKKNKKKHIERVAKVNAKKAAELRKLVNKIKDVPCTDCGNRYPPCVMDFDHVRGVKEFSISARITNGCSKRKILLEIKKCEVVCANCHRIRTHILYKGL